MKLEISQLEKYKDITNDLLEVVNANLENFNKTRDDEKNPLENFEFEIEGVGFCFCTVYNDNWEDDGKYQHQNEIGQLVAWDKSIESYPCTDSILEEYNLFGEVFVSRSGSYYSEYYYSYEEMNLFKYEIEHVEERIIPSHDRAIKKYN